jgi:hypothetical protein
MNEALQCAHHAPAPDVLAEKLMVNVFLAHRQMPYEILAAPGESHWATAPIQFSNRPSCQTFPHQAVNQL